MATSSMSLESLYFLLQHMEANRRFEISRRCPSLREIEKSVPLKIDSLVLAANYVVVNDTEYNLGVFQKCHVGEAPRHVAERNEEGGVAYEVDEYGIEDKLDAIKVTPGDVVMSHHEDLFMQIEDLHEPVLENRIQHYEGLLADERERRPNRNLEEVHQLEKTIGDARAELFDYQCRRHNIPSRYERFLQLTKSQKVDEKEQQIIERYKHNKKFSEAVKQMTTMLFGGRSSPIHVTKFKFFVPQGVIRLPVGLKFHIEKLIFRDEASKLEALTPILHESLFPLKKLKTAFLTVDDVANPIVATSGILSIGMILGDDLQTISAITNAVVRVTIRRLPDETIEELIEIWLESRRPIGTNHTYYFHHEPFFVDEIEDILKRLNGVLIDDENVIILMNEVTQLKVSYGPFPEFAPTSPWAARFLTEAVQH